MSVFYASLEDAAGVLRSGGVLLLPTDTLPGLHARADRPEALARIAALKRRDKDRPLLVLAASTEQAMDLAAPLDERRIDFCRRCWPGPFSLILPARDGLDEIVTTAAGTGGATLAVRVPDDAELCALIIAAGAPLASTSANLAGQPPITDLATAAATFADGIDGWWRPAGDPVDRAVAATASALVDVTLWPPRVLRPGPLPAPGI